MPKAIIYTRVSTEEQAENNTSLEDQVSRGKFQALGRGLEVVGVYADEGISGTRYETRPALQEALAVIERKEAEVLIVLKIDRLARNAKIVLQIAERIDRAGGQLLTCDGQEYGKTPTGKLMLTMLAGFSEFERSTIRERGMNGMKARAKSGVQPIRGIPPLGYYIVQHRDAENGLYPSDAVGTYQINEATAPIVREIFARFDSGESLGAIMRRLEANGVPAPKGGERWAKTTLARLLTNSVYKGEASYGRRQTIYDETMRQKRDPSKTLASSRVIRPESEWIPIAAPALVDAAQWERVQRRMTQNYETRQAQLGGNPGRKWMLSGLCVCPTCGQRLRGHHSSSDGHRYNYYDCMARCEGKRKAFRAEKMEALVCKAVRYVAEQPEGIRAALAAYDADQAAIQAGGSAEATRKEIEAKLAELETELKTTKKAMLTAIRAGLSEDDFAADLEAIASRRKQLETQRAALGPQAQPPASKGEAKDVTEKLAAVAAAIERVLSAPPELYTPGEKQALLTRIIESITPTLEGEGAEVRLKSETVATILLVATVSGSVKIQIVDALAEAA